MPRYKRVDVIRWLESEGCELDGEPAPKGLAFYTRSGIPFAIPDPDDDGWLDVGLIEMVLTDRWIGVGPCPFPSTQTVDPPSPIFAKRE